MIAIKALLKRVQTMEDKLLPRKSWKSETFFSQANGFLKASPHFSDATEGVLLDTKTDKHGVFLRFHAALAKAVRAYLGGGTGSGHAQASCLCECE